MVSFLVYHFVLGHLGVLQDVVKDVLMLGFCIYDSLITCFGTTAKMCISAMLSVGNSNLMRRSGGV